VSSAGQGRARIFREYVLDMRNMPLAAVMLALVFQLAGIPRPGVFFPVDLLMVVSISAYYFSTGMNFITDSFSSYLRENLVLCAIKFIAVPSAAAVVLGLTNLGHDVEAVILIQSFMPAAIYSVLASVLFDLDTKLSTNLFVVNTLVFLMLVLPLLFLFKAYIF
jgi:predicted permease